jgi:hypothetical protein
MERSIIAMLARTAEGEDKTVDWEKFFWEK